MTRDLRRSAPLHTFRRTAPSIDLAVRGARLVLSIHLKRAKVDKAIAFDLKNNGDIERLVTLHGHGNFR